MLRDRFTTLCKNFSSDQALINQLWLEIEEAYQDSSRHYHNLTHLVKIYNELPKYDYVTEFAIFYHDIIYDVTKSDNEEQSAQLCKERLSNLNVKPTTIMETTTLIRETKTHNPSSPRNALFLDADLVILGSNSNEYREYTQKIRAEYRYYSEKEYIIGRMKVLTHFLKKERIYHSDHFYTQYESVARENILKELDTLKLSNASYRAR